MALARLLEEQGHFNQAIQLWELVRKARPQDVEAQDKVKQLAATETIARGNYEEATATGETAEGPACKLETTPAPTARLNADERPSSA